MRLLRSKNENAALLSNYEVLVLLRELQNENKGPKGSKDQQNLATLSYETINYLEKTPCVHQDPDCVNKFLKALETFDLTKAEKLQLLNHRPTTLVEIQLLIEESEERLTEESINELLDTVNQNLPTAETEVPEMETD